MGSLLPDSDQLESKGTGLKMNFDKKWVTLNNGAKMPTIGMGTWHHGPREEIDAALRFSLENGYRHIDCAKVYLNEKEVGQVFNDYIGKSIPREDLFIIGKLWGTITTQTMWKQLVENPWLT